ncbi:MAG: DUF169 domain-containing protein [Firmicutes bacterium]|nr:DUF169 domain-containing protein [Bacillota bacterium]
MNIPQKIEALLDLEQPRVAIAFLDEVPEQLPTFGGTSPSACHFWVKAQTSSFYASREQHANCPIGMLTMGYALSDSESSEADIVMKTMCDLQYFGSEEAISLPRRSHASPYIAYGPAATSPITADLDVGVGQAWQMMIVMEAVDGMTCAGAPMALMGRPACAALPTALAQRRTVISLACVGARTYTGIDKTEGFFVIPSDAAQAYAERMVEVAAANEALRVYHQHRLLVLG